MSWVASVMALMFSIITHPISGARSLRRSLRQLLRRSLGLGGDRPVGMPQIAAPVAPPHVVDQGIRPLALHLERGDQRILRRYRYALVFASDVYADGEFQHHGDRFLATSIRGDARLGFFELREPHL